MKVAFSGNTSNQLTHLYNHHKDIYAIAKPYKEQPPPRPNRNSQNRVGLMDDTIRLRKTIFVYIYYVYDM